MGGEAGGPTGAAGSNPHPTSQPGVTESSESSVGIKSSAWHSSTQARPAREPWWAVRRGRGQDPRSPHPLQAGRKPRQASGPQLPDENPLRRKITSVPLSGLQILPEKQSQPHGSWGSPGKASARWPHQGGTEPRGEEGSAPAVETPMSPTSPEVTAKGCRGGRSQWRPSRQTLAAVLAWVVACDPEQSLLATPVSQAHLGLSDLLTPTLSGLKLHSPKHKSDRSEGQPGPQGRGSAAVSQVPSPLGTVSDTSNLRRRGST
ncbi:uncharacterized protein LOC117284485 [Fukomys damarensis]|uniref:uncharacterized protein LOC117284485 n=1 Tax=Fukomys damarensis TaxID=885580 RepID=UPI0014556639|nr:uncharacterized protein LOC117284485 [Fukomys damarensis]